MSLQTWSVLTCRWHVSRTILLLMVFVSVSIQQDLQSLLNQFCKNNPTSAGCETSVATTQRPVVEEGKHQGDRGTPPCSSSSRLCTQLKNVCVPNNIGCHHFDVPQPCRKPEGLGFAFQVLLCGDGTAEGVLCGNITMVPPLTQLLVQCLGANTIGDVGSVTSLGLVADPGGSSSAGVYRCGTSGSWESLYGSPHLQDLISSCSNAGCGKVLLPDSRTSVDRRWASVRAILTPDGVPFCTGTLVSPSALITAAHCVARTAVSKTPVSPDELWIELPGLSQQHPSTRVKATEVHMHPDYNPQQGLQYDLAVIMFKKQRRNLPIMCLSPSNLTPPTEASKVVFRLGEDRRSRTKVVFSNGAATLDQSCQPITTRFAAPCVDILFVQESQFCASHPGISMNRGSSGGPFLVEMGRKVDEVWVLAGVLSQFSNESSCMQDHSIYSSVSESSDWVRRCLFKDGCNSPSTST